MYTTIAKTFTFDAAHFIPTVPEDHKCRRMHGHTYVVELRFTGQTKENGFCAGIDYADIHAAWMSLAHVLDHHVLNEVPGLEVPTTENLVEWIIRELRRPLEHSSNAATKSMELARALLSVRVKESSTTWCEGLVS